jgi:hypothetical protein
VLTVVLGLLAAAGGYLAFGGSLDSLGSLGGSLGLSGGAGDSGGAAAEPAAPEGAPGSDPAAAGLPGLGQEQVPPCPFTADRVSALVGQPMVDKGDCLFGDGNGVAQIGIEPHTATATGTTYDYSRDRATRVYNGQVQDVGAKGYLAYKDTEAEAVVINAKGGFTITMSGFQRLSGSGYDPVLRAVIDALPR